MLRDSFIPLPITMPLLFICLDLLRCGKRLYFVAQLGSKLVLLVVYGFGKIVAQLFKLVKLSCFRAR